MTSTLLVFIPLFFILILIFYLLPATSVFYHLYRFGLKKDLSQTIAMIFLFGSIVLLILCLFFILATNWSEIVELINL